MNRPTPFENMRRNRPKVERSRNSLRDRIDRLEREVCDWSVAAEAAIEDVQEQLTVARQVQPRPGLLRRVFNFACGLGENA